MQLTKDIIETIFIPKWVITHGYDSIGDKVISDWVEKYFLSASWEIQKYVKDNITWIIWSMMWNDASFLEDFTKRGSVQDTLFTTLTSFDVFFDTGKDNKITHRVTQRMS